MRNSINISIYSSLIFLVVTISALGQPVKKDESLVYKRFNPNSRGRIFIGPPIEYSYALEEKFDLIQKANNGNPQSQHDLGIRTLIGLGFNADTAKAFYWISKSAEQGFTSAKYNLGIFQLNGWGCDWNPFEAYKNIKAAAIDGMAQAQYVYGMLLTDNIITAKNLPRAYTYVELSAKAGYEPAKQSLEKMKVMGVKPEPIVTDSLPNLIGSLNDKQSKPPTQKQNEKKKPEQNSTTSSVANNSLLVYINFDPDTVSAPTDSSIIADFYRESGLDSLFNQYDLSKFDSHKDSLSLAKMDLMIRYGSPEAMALKGLMFQKGIIYNKDDFEAALLFTKAIRAESNRARFLLWTILRDVNLLNRIISLSDSGDPNGMYLYATLNAIGFDTKLNINEIFTLWNNAAKKRNSSAMIEVGKCFSAGNPVEKNINLARDYWTAAFELGDLEGKLRIIFLDFFTSVDFDKSTDYFKFTKNAAMNGSLLGETISGVCYERGLGVTPNKAEAAIRYRNASVRGSELGYRSLLKLYDSLRPKEAEFTVENKIR